MKKTKLFACLAAACVTLSSAAVIAACGEPDDGKGPGGSGQAATEWQFTGVYHDLMDNGFDFYFLGNMYEGGEGVIYHAQWNSDKVTYTEIEVEWESATDRDGLTTFNASTDDASAAFTEVSLYAESDGSFVWEYKFIFAGGYSAGYYSYKWAEVLDADAFALFRERGIFDHATAESFRRNVLSRGGTEHPMTLYKRFRGQEPTIDALLRRNGIKRPEA